MALTFPEQISAPNQNGAINFPGEDDAGKRVVCSCTSEALQDDFHGSFDSNRFQIEEIASNKHTAGVFDGDQIWVRSGDLQKYS